MAKNMMIRNSTAEFLTFIAEGKEDGIQVLYKNESIWATQKAMSLLFDCSTDNIGLHLKNIYESGELDRGRTTAGYGGAYGRPPHPDDNGRLGKAYGHHSGSRLNDSELLDM